MAQEIPVDYGAVDELTYDPDVSDVDPDELSFDPEGGKDLRAIVRFEDQFARVRPKQEFHVVTDDGDVYVWTRFGGDEPWTFDYRRTDGQEHDTASRTLPGIVEAIVEQRGLLY